MNIFQADVRVNSLLMKFRFLVSFCRNKIKQIVPNLVFEKNFCAFHLKTDLKYIQVNLLVGWKLIEILNKKLMLYKKLFLYLFYKFLNRVYYELAGIFRSGFIVFDENHLYNFIKRKAIFRKMFLIFLNFHYKITKALEVALFLLLFLMHFGLN